LIYRLANELLSFGLFPVGFFAGFDCACDGISNRVLLAGHDFLAPLDQVLGALTKFTSFPLSVFAAFVGPGSKVFDMAFTKIFPLKEARVLEFRAQATNVFNLVNYSSIDTNLNSPTFGRVTAAGGMRQITLTARFRF